eukprot:SAG22_NODE_45_length_24718_cov_12.462448_14_plen_547_part_00
MPRTKTEVRELVAGLGRTDLRALIVEAASRLEQLGPESEDEHIREVAAPPAAPSPPRPSPARLSAGLEFDSDEEHFEEVGHVEASPVKSAVARQLAGYFRSNHHVNPLDTACLAADAHGAPLSAGAELGRCRFGVVRRAIYTAPPPLGAAAELPLPAPPPPQAVAVKIRLVPRSNKSAFEELAEEFLGEIATVAKLAHPNIIGFVGAAFEGGLLAVTELAARGSLAALLESGHDPVQQYAGLRESLVHDIATGMAYLHGEAVGADGALLPAAPLLHRQLCPQNVLVTAGSRAKLTGAGTRNAGLLDSDSARWTAPELFTASLAGGGGQGGGGKGFEATTAADVWAYGCTLYQIESGRRPWAELETHEIVMELTSSGGTDREQSRPVFPDSNPFGLPVDASLCGLVRRCWAEQPSSRPSFAELLGRIEAAAVTKKSAYWQIAGFGLPLPPHQAVPLRPLPAQNPPPPLHLLELTAPEPAPAATARTKKKKTAKAKEQKEERKSPRPPPLPAELASPKQAAPAAAAPAARPPPLPAHMASMLRSGLSK